MATGEITLRDLVAWTEMIAADGAPSSDSTSVSDTSLDRDVEWVVTARSTSPMLPNLRGGELVLLPERVVAETPIGLNMLIQELTNQPVAGVVLDSREEIVSTLPVLRAAHIGSELESDLNRMLTTRRGDLLRIGTQIERIINSQRAEETGPEALLEALSLRLGMQFVIASSSGEAIVSTTDAYPRIRRTDDTGPNWLHRPLRHDRWLLVGPLEPEMHALGRFVLNATVDAVQQILDDEATAVQDHASRTRIINQALTTAGTDVQSAHAMLRRAGILPDTRFRIAVASSPAAERAIWPLLGSLGTPIDAGTLENRPWWLVVDDGHQRPAGDHQSDDWIVVSAPLTGSGDFRAGIRQVEFLIAAKDGKILESSVVRFDDTAHLGALRLLFDHWGCAMLDDFVESMIGPLLREDRRGQLRSTLRTYLAFGGTQRVTAEHLSIHRNTLAYRLRQIRQCLAVDPDDPEAGLGLHLALIAAELPAPRTHDSIAPTA